MLSCHGRFAAAVLAVWRSGELVVVSVAAHFRLIRCPEPCKSSRALYSVHVWICTFTAVFFLLFVSFRFFWFSLIKNTALPNSNLDLSIIVL